MLTKAIDAVKGIPTKQKQAIFNCHGKHNTIIRKDKKKS